LGTEGANQKKWLEKRVEGRRREGEENTGGEIVSTLWRKRGGRKKKGQKKKKPRKRGRGGTKAKKGLNTKRNNGKRKNITYGEGYTPGGSWTEWEGQTSIWGRIHHSETVKKCTRGYEKREKKRLGGGIYKLEGFQRGGPLKVREERQGGVTSVWNQRQHKATKCLKKDLGGHSQIGGKGGTPIKKVPEGGWGTEIKGFGAVLVLSKATRLKFPHSGVGVPGGKFENQG